MQDGLNPACFLFLQIEQDLRFCIIDDAFTVTAEDEWLHAFFYFNDETPTEAAFEKAIGEYLTFEFSMIMQNRDYLFENEGGSSAED